MPLVPGDGILSQGQRSCCDFRFVYTALMASIATQYTVDITFRKYRAKARHRSLHAETSEVVSCSAHREIIGSYQSLLNPSAGLEALEALVARAATGMLVMWIPASAVAMLYGLKGQVSTASKGGSVTSFKS